MGLPLLVADLALFGACLGYELFLERELEKFRITLPNGVEATGKDLMYVICRTYDAVGLASLAKMGIVGGLRIILVSGGSIGHLIGEGLEYILTVLRRYAEKVLSPVERAYLARVLRDSILRYKKGKLEETKRRLIEEYIKPFADSTEIAGQIEALGAKGKKYEFYSFAHLEIFGFKGLKLESEKSDRLIRHLNEALNKVENLVKQKKYPEAESLYKLLQELEEIIKSEKGFGLSITAVGTGEGVLKSFTDYGKMFINTVGDISPFVISAYRDVRPNVWTPKYFATFYHVKEEVARKAMEHAMKAGIRYRERGGGIIFGDGIVYWSEEMYRSQMRSALDYTLELVGVKRSIREHIVEGRIHILARIHLDEARSPSEAWLFLDSLDVVSRLYGKEVRGYISRFRTVRVTHEGVTKEFRIGRLWGHPAILVLPPVGFHLFSGVEEDSWYHPRRCSIPFGEVQEEFVGGEGKIG